MIEGRDSMGFALPFTAGIMSACLIAHQTYWNSATAMLAAEAAATILLMSGRLRGSRTYTAAAIAVAVFFTGMFCHMSARTGSIGRTIHAGPLRDFAYSLCAAVKRSIDDIPFGNPESSGLIKALLTGDRTSVTPETIRVFRQSGASHILALSGLHLGIIYGMISKVTVLTGNSLHSRRLRSFINVAACGLYTLATGAGESITRSFLFILLNEAAGMTGRRHSLREIFPSALIIQLAYDPLAAESVSFRLSYAAMAGITFIHPALKRFWPEGKGRDGRSSCPMRKVWELASLSISCQLTTWPIVWHTFHSFPHNFILTNIISVPLTGLLIPFSIVTVILYSAGLCPELLIRITECLVSALSGSLETIASM